MSERCRERKNLESLSDKHLKGAAEYSPERVCELGGTGRLGSVSPRRGRRNGIYGSVAPFRGFKIYRITPQPRARRLALGFIPSPFQGFSDSLLSQRSSCTATWSARLRGSRQNRVAGEK